MINIHLLLYSGSYDRKICVDMKFPAVPRIGDLVCLSENKEAELVRKLMVNRRTMNNYRCWLAGLNTDDISLNIEDACKVKEIDWWPADDGESMECYLILTSPEDITRNIPYITEDQYLLAKKTTCRLYGIEDPDPQEDR